MKTTPSERARKEIDGIAASMYGHSEPEEPTIDVTNIKPITLEELRKILSLTIKKDNTNKILTFLCELSAYTEDSQFNISFNAPSSTGKSYIPMEIATLFPEKDVMEIGGCSPTAFFHNGKPVKDKDIFIMDLSRKILIFLDQPHNLLLEKLRPLLSHDKKEIEYKITDKSQKHGLRTKTVLLIGYPSAIFCSAKVNMDEQEATRLLLLSPESDELKIREAVANKIRKDANKAKFHVWLDENPERMGLKDRILAIKQARIEHIIIENPEKIESLFWDRKKNPKPKDQRDIGRIISIIKSLALLNLWFRKRDGNTIYVNDEDIACAFELWDKVSEAQDLNLPPYILELYKMVLVPLWEERNYDGLNKRDVLKKYYTIFHSPLSSWKFDKEIAPMLEDAGLIHRLKNPDPIADKREKLIYSGLRSTGGDI